MSYDSEKHEPKTMKAKADLMAKRGSISEKQRVTRRRVGTIGAALVVGAILAAAQRLAPDLVPWLQGWMIACIAANLRYELEKP